MIRRADTPEKRGKAFDTVGRQASTEHDPKDGHSRKKRDDIRRKASIDKTLTKRDS